jgi:hypothetical protein
MAALAVEVNTNPSCEGVMRAAWRQLWFLCLLFAVGWALYLVLPPAPRWRVPGYYWLQGFADEGKVAVVVTLMPQAEQRQPAEWRYAWLDVDSGQTVRKLDFVCSYSLLSPNFNVLAAGDGKAFWFIDTATGHKTTVQGEWEKSPYTTTDMRFSRSGRWLIRKRGTTAYLFDTASGKIQKQWDGVTDQYWYVPGTERFVLSLKDDKDERLATWDAEHDTELASLGPYRRWHALGQHARFVIGSPAGDDSCLHVIDLHKKEVVLKLPAAKRPLSRFAVSDDGRQAAFWFQEQDAERQRVEFWDAYGRIKCSETMVARGDNQAVFAPDGSTVILFRGGVDTTAGTAGFPAPTVRVFDVAAGKELWRRPDRSLLLNEVRFSADSSRIGIRTGDDTFEFFDAATGAARQTIALFPQSAWSSAQASGAYPPRWSHDRRYLVFCHHDVSRTLRLPLIESGIQFPNADEICVLDVHEQRVAANLRIKGLANQEFTTHGPSVLTCQEDSDGPHLTAWDVPPRKRWLWIVGGPGALGVVLVGFRRYRQPQRGDRQ